MTRPSQFLSSAVLTLSLLETTMRGGARALFRLGLHKKNVPRPSPYDGESPRASQSARKLPQPYTPGRLGDAIRRAPCGQGACGALFQGFAASPSLDLREGT